MFVLDGPLKDDIVAEVMEVFEAELCFRVCCLTREVKFRHARVPQAGMDYVRWSIS